MNAKNNTQIIIPVKKPTTEIIPNSEIKVNPAVSHQPICKGFTNAIPNPNK